MIDLRSGEPAGPTLESVGRVFHGAFLPGGSRMVIQTPTSVRAWDWRTGQTRWGPSVLPSTGYSVSASPDGRRVVSLCADRGLLLDAADGKTIAEFVHEGEPDLLNSAPHAAFSADGGCFVTFLSWEDVRVWDARTARPRFLPLRHSGRVEAVAFSPDGRFLATASNDQTGRVFDLGTGRERTKLEHPGWVVWIAYDEDGRRLLTTSRDGRFWLWREGELACPPMSPGNPIGFSAIFLAGTPWLMTQSKEAAQVWDSVLGKPLTPPLPLPEGAGCLQLVDGGRQAAAFCERQARVFDLAPLTDDEPQPVSLEHRRLLAEVQSTHTIHEGGGVVQLTTAEWLQRWRKLRAERPELTPWPDER